MKPYVLAMLAYLVPSFPLGYFWHLVVFADRYHALAMYRDDVIIPFGLGSMGIQALAFAWAYPRLFGAKDERWGRGAAKFALVFGALAWSFAVLPVAAKYRMSSVIEFLWLETAFTVVHFAIIAPLIALAWQGSRRVKEAGGHAA